MQEISAQPSEARKAVKRTEFGLKEEKNPLFTLSLDPFRYVHCQLHSIIINTSLMYIISSTPVETLHTILLGPYKYLLKATMSGLTKQQKQEVLARMRAFNYSGFNGKVLGNVVYHHQSFVGRDYKAWAQMAPFIVGTYRCTSQIHKGRCYWLYPR